MSATLTPGSTAVRGAELRSDDLKFWGAQRVLYTLALTKHHSPGGNVGKCAQSMWLIISC
jgi:hypothetical protein